MVKAKRKHSNPYFSLIKEAPTNIRDPSFQTFLYDFFSGKQRSKPPRSNELVGDGNRCILKKKERAYPRLSLHQNSVAAIARVLAHNPDNNNRGLLAWHSTGSGKTCTATAVMDAFWETDRRILYVSSTEALASNPPANFHKCALQFMRRFNKRVFRGKTREERLEKVRRAFEKRGVEFTTFAKLAHFLLLEKPLKRLQGSKAFHQNYLDNAIVIIDEVQNIFKPLPHQRAESNALRRFFLKPENQRIQNMKLVVLTATPGDTPEDLVHLLNMVRDHRAPEIRVPDDTTNAETMQKFQDQVRGLVSYFDMSSDTTKFPVVQDDQSHKVPMSEAQFKDYVKATQEEAPSKRDFAKLAHGHRMQQYMEKSRKYSNMRYLFPENATLEQFSAKLPALLEVIQKYPNEKHYIYSSFHTKTGFGGQGIHAIAALLESELGYSELRPQSKELLEPTLEAKPRYILATSKNLANKSTAINRAGQNLRELLRVFNSPENQKGEQVQLFLASQGYNEGVDLKDVRHVHLFEPLLTLAADRQAIGRAARYCSHAGLDREAGEWTVKVHRYYSKEPLDLKQYSTEHLELKIRELEAEKGSTLEKLEAIKGKRGVSDQREQLKRNVTSIQQSIRDAESKIKKLGAINIENIRMIDERIANEAQKRAGSLQRIYKAVFDTAIDCMLFEKFHNESGGRDIQCDIQQPTPHTPVVLLQPQPPRKSRRAKSSAALPTDQAMQKRSISTPPPLPPPPPPITEPEPQPQPQPEPKPMRPEETTLENISEPNITNTNTNSTNTKTNKNSNTTKNTVKNTVPKPEPEPESNSDNTSRYATPVKPEPEPESKYTTPEPSPAMPRAEANNVQVQLNTNANTNAIRNSKKEESKSFLGKIMNAMPFLQPTKVVNTNAVIRTASKYKV